MQGYYENIIPALAEEPSGSRGSTLANVARALTSSSGIDWLNLCLLNAFEAAIPVYYGLVQTRVAEY